MSFLPMLNVLCLHLGQIFIFFLKKITDLLSKAKFRQFFVEKLDINSGFQYLTVITVDSFSFSFILQYKISYGCYFIASVITASVTVVCIFSFPEVFIVMSLQLLFNSVTEWHINLNWCLICITRLAW